MTRGVGFLATLRGLGVVASATACGQCEEILLDETHVRDVRCLASLSSGVRALFARGRAAGAGPDARLAEAAATAT